MTTIIYFAAEIIMLEGLTCIYRSSVDLIFYVIGSAQENEVCNNTSSISNFHHDLFFNNSIFNGCYKICKDDNKNF